MTLGEIYAITASATWAMSSVLVRTQTDRVGVLVINLPTWVTMAQRSDAGTALVCSGIGVPGMPTLIRG